MYFYLITVCSVSAATCSISVLDEQGAPLPDAIIFVANSEVDGAEGLRVMDQKNKQFLPSTLLIQQGQTVRFPNSDNIRHNVYSFSQVKSFELALYGDSRAPDVNFNKPGAVAIACNIHDQMRGFIFVSPGPQAWQTNQQGEAMIPDTLTQASVWHPRLSVNGTESVAVSIRPGSHIVVALKPEIKPVSRTLGSRAFGIWRWTVDGIPAQTGIKNNAGSEYGSTDTLEQRPAGLCATR